MTQLRADTDAAGPVALDVHHRPRHRARPCRCSRSSSRTRCRSSKLGVGDQQPDLLPPDRRLGRPGHRRHDLRHRASSRSCPRPARRRRGRRRRPSAQFASAAGDRRASTTSSASAATSAQQILAGVPEPSGPRCSRSSRHDRRRASTEAFTIGVAATFQIGVVDDGPRALALALFLEEIPLRTPHRRGPGAAAPATRTAAPGRPTGSPPPSDLAPPLDSTAPVVRHRGRRSCPRRTIAAMDRDRRALPAHLQALGTADAPFERAARRRRPARPARCAGSPVATSTSCSPTRPTGIVATDDRCPHMSAPLSIGDARRLRRGLPAARGPVRPGQRRPGPDADDRRPRSRRPLSPDVVAGRARRRRPTRPARRPRRGG